MTQELIAEYAGGTPREGNCGRRKRHLQDAGLIHYCRGRISILNRRGLESNVCECYRIVEDEVDRLFGREPQFSQSRIFAEAGRANLSIEQNCQAASSKRWTRLPPLHSA